MESQEFSRLRKKLNKTQKQLSELLGASLKAVHSYEQGWRGIPVHVERQLLFLVFLSNEGLQNKTCWETLNCPAFRKETTVLSVRVKRKRTGRKKSKSAALVRS